MKGKIILSALGQVENQYIEEAEPVQKENKNMNRKKWLSVAVCFALVAIIGVGVFQSGLSETKTEIATLENGGKITFVRGDTIAVLADLDATIRKLSDEEIKMLFADLPVTANAYFNPYNHNILGFEGEIGDVKLVVSMSGTKLLDAVVEGSQYTSVIDGTSVNAGYFVTNANNQGGKNIIYYAEFDIGENSVYVEYSGELEQKDAVKKELTDAILKLIENGEFDLKQIREQAN